MISFIGRAGGDCGREEGGRGEGSESGDKRVVVVVSQSAAAPLHCRVTIKYPMCWFVLAPSDFLTKYGSVAWLLSAAVCCLLLSDQQCNAKYSHSSGGDDRDISDVLPQC